MCLTAKPHPNRVCLGRAEYTNPLLRHSLAFTFSVQQSMKDSEMPNFQAQRRSSQASRTAYMPKQNVVPVGV